MTRIGSRDGKQNVATVDIGSCGWNSDAENGECQVAWRWTYPGIA